MHVGMFLALMVESVQRFADTKLPESLSGIGDQSLQLTSPSFMLTAMQDRFLRKRAGALRTPPRRAVQPAARRHPALAGTPRRPAFTLQPPAQALQDVEAPAAQSGTADQLQDGDSMLLDEGETQQLPPSFRSDSVNASASLLTCLRSPSPSL